VSNASGRASGDVRAYDDAPCALLTADPAGMITRVNRTFERWTGYAADEVVGRRRLQDLFAPGDRIYYETHLAPLLHMQGEVRAIAVNVLNAAGERLPALVAVRLVPGERAASRIHAAVFDARDRRAYERELLREKQRAEDSERRARLLAQTLQESLIPPTPPRIPSLDVSAVYRPAGRGDEVGGDFYDVFQVPGGAWAVVLGDVTGKGVGAAVVTALARYTIRAAVMRSSRPRDVLATLNGALLRGQEERPVTAVYATVAPEDVVVTIAAGGHPLPLLIRDARARPVGRPGMMLGVADDPPLPEERLQMRAGEAIVFYTDGITEARRGRDEWFGEERLVDVVSDLQGRAAAEIASTLVEQVVEFQRGDPRDDIAVVVLAVPA
jgi:sigma-B regulation protein RsbU (phosphoserine phosphatase)